MTTRGRASTVPTARLAVVRAAALGAALAAAAGLLAAGCSGVAPSGRYAAEHFRTTRSNFEYVRDRVTGEWVNRHCELRAPVARPLPDPLMTDAHGTALSVQLHEPGSARSGGLRSVNFTVRDGHRVWVIEDVLGPVDVQGRTKYGVSVKWYTTGQETRHDPLELFHMPRLGNEPPRTWGPWVVASSTREGAFGWWSEAQGAPPAPATPIPHPFELRCQIVPTDTPGVVR